MMAESISVSNAVIQTVTQSSWSGVGVQGVLIGEVAGSSPTSVTAVWQKSLGDISELKNGMEECLAHFPGGQQVVGFVLIPRNAKSAKSIQDQDQGGIDREFEEVLGGFETWLDQLGLSRMLCLCLWRDSSSPVESFLHSMFTVWEEGVEHTEVKTVTKTRSRIRMRLKADLPLLLSTESEAGDQLKSALEQEQLKLQNQIGNFVFGFLDNSVLMHQSGAVVVGAGGPEGGVSTCKDILRHWKELEGSNSSGGGGSKKKGAASAAMFQAPVPVSLIQLARAESAPSLQYAPIIRHQTGTFKTTRVVLPLDTLVELEEKTTLSGLASILTTSVSRQITLLFQCLDDFTKKGQLQTPEVFHFLLAQLDTPISVVYPMGLSEESLESRRKKVHQHLCLPNSTPLLRRGCAGHFLGQRTPAGYLLNTHLGLPEPPVKDATTCLVQGYYSYHHYMQDRFNDDKWGCAYRSLQTICSWFLYQGYTTRDIPTHREIQQALCDIGDKEPKFVGSRQWIGSFEVSFVLDHLLGVTSKFINVNSGAELSTIGQQLMEHFHSQGTPVMIGGGVLAHTILGVAYSELTGDIAFLILDPHYTGGEDLALIQDKGWCGWKDMKFWNQTAHYNLCLPQRPTGLV